MRTNVVVWRMWWARQLLRRALGALLTGAAIAPWQPALAQAVTPQLSVAGGSVTDARGVTSNALTLTPSLALMMDPRLSLMIAASATRFETSDWQLGASGSLAARTTAWNGAAMSLNVGGGVSRSSFGATFVVSEAVPALEWSVGKLTAFGGARVASGNTSVQGLVPMQGNATDTLSTLSRTSAGPVFGAQWRIIDDLASSSAVVGYREERAHVGGELVVDRTVGLSAVVGAIAVGGTLGDRTSPSERLRYASGSASFSITPGWSIDVSAGRYPANRLTGTAAGRFVNAGMSVRFGGVTAMRSLPPVHGAPAPATGMTRLSIRVEDALRVEVAGDWNDWTPVSAHTAADGVWYVDLPLAPGEYRYAFLVDGKQWKVPTGAVVTDDGFGGKSAYVTVPGDAAPRNNHDEEER